MTYPVTITLDQLRALDACAGGIKAFREVAPSGSLTITDVHAHVALLSGSLAAYEAWAIQHCMLQPITLTGGHESTLTGGYRSTLTGGYRSTLTGGHESTLTGGHESTLTGGDWSTLTGGYRSTLTGGYRSTLTGGYRSTLTGGHESTLTGGHKSTLTGGDWSTLTGGYRSTLTGGYRSTLCWRIWDGQRYRLHVVYVGEDDIQAGTPYRCVGGTVRKADDILDPDADAVQP